MVIPAGDPLLENALMQVWQGRVQRVALLDDPLHPSTPLPNLIGEIKENAEQMLVCDNVLINLPIPGTHNARNLLLAMAVAQELEIKIENLARLEVELPNGRARTINLQAELAGVTILDETYNASPEAVLASLDMLAQQPGRRFAVIGTMLELGEQSVNLHRMVAERAAALAIDGLFVFADDAEAEAIIAAGASINLIERVYSLKEAADKLKNLLKAGDYLLLKASRGVSLEKIIPMLQTRN